MKRKILAQKFALLPYCSGSETDYFYSVRSVSVTRASPSVAVHIIFFVLTLKYYLKRAFQNLVNVRIILNGATESKSFLLSTNKI